MDALGKMFITFAADENPWGKTAERVFSHLNDCHEDGSECHLVLTGGRDGSKVTRELVHLISKWKKNRPIHFWWADERFVPKDHLDRNDKIISELGLTASTKFTTHFIGEPANGDIDAVARQYSHEIEGIEFCIAVLGLGPDGHVASNFEECQDLASNNQSDVIAVRNAPKSPQFRITMSMRRLMTAKTIVMIASGQDKAEIIAQLKTKVGNSPAHELAQTRPIEMFLDFEANNQSKCEA